MHVSQKHVKGVTPIGEALFAHLIKPEEFNGKSTGKYTVLLKLAPQAAGKLKAEIETEYHKFQEMADNSKKKFPLDYACGVKEYKGEEYFKFGMRAEIECKDGSVIAKHVPIFDASKKEVSKTLAGLGNGSKVRIAYELVPFFMTKTNAGVSLRLTGVQVIDLVEYGSQSAGALGFGTEEGYTSDADEIPFTNSSAPADDAEGDF